MFIAIITDLFNIPREMFTVFSLTWRFCQQQQCPYNTTPPICEVEISNYWKTGYYLTIKHNDFLSYIFLYQKTLYQDLVSNDLKRMLSRKKFSGCKEVINETDIYFEPKYT